MLGELVAWGEAEDEIRALVLTSTRSQQDGSADELSDYDLIVAVRDADDFVAREGWAGARGRPLVGWGDEHELLGERTTFRGAVYRDGVRVDFTIWTASLLESIAAADALPDDLDVGYRVLLDKDGATSRWSAPTYLAHVPTRPTALRVRGDRRRVLVVDDVRREGALARRARVREVRPRSRREARRAPPRPRVEDRARPRLEPAARRATGEGSNASCPPTSWPSCTRRTRERAGRKPGSRSS